MKAAFPQRFRRPARLRPALSAVAGVLSAFALIGGSLAALDHEVLSNDQWHRFEGGDGGRPVVLAPATPTHTEASSGGSTSAFDPLPAAAPAGRGLATVTRAAERATGGTPAPADSHADEARIIQLSRMPQSDHSLGAGTDALPDPDRDGLTTRSETRLGTDPQKSDTDGDTLPDGWEARHGLDPRSSSDALQDPDGDGLWNVTEFDVRSDPRVADTDGNGRPDGTDDTDGDGLPNDREQQLADDPTATDSDGDGVTDGSADADGDGVADAADDQAASDTGESLTDPSDSARTGDEAADDGGDDAATGDEGEPPADPGPETDPAPGAPTEGDVPRSATVPQDDEAAAPVDDAPVTTTTPAP